MDEVWIRVITIIIGSGGFTSGIWTFLQHRDTKRNAWNKITMGLAYAELTRKGQEYLDRGSISKDELEDYLKYFYTPYKDLGGNGVAERYMLGVRELPIRRNYDFHMNSPNEEYTNNVRIISPAHKGSAE